MLPDQDSPERAARFVPPMHLSQHAEGANSNPVTEGDMASGPDTFQSIAVVSNAQVTSRHAGQKGEQVGKKQIWLMPAAKTGQAGWRENERMSSRQTSAGPPGYLAMRRRRQ